ncbi:short-chain dehydrogenase [Streptococcus varani]|uniref:Short-chain dehydrogenase n=1 Tax=Streptococcus varani TaxID=1608583 RepID=A0A0E4H4Z4_9STRE|nr:SDR family oxidoreductase [Streptococcus varani]CQR24675.1 short-chain dehydrogenase [Streptococcus varani]
MRNILITGASGGIAQAMLPLLKDDFLILLGRNASKMEALYVHHSNKAIFEVDMTDEKELATLIAKIYQELGKIDVLVNNAGYAIYDDFENFSDQQVRDMFDINLFALMTLCRLVGKEMKKVKSGHIINIVSMSGKIASAKSSVYSATKFAALGFSDTIRLELMPYNIGVTTVNPGPVATGFFELADPDGSYQKSVKAFMISPDKVARKIVAAMGTKKREINLPFALQVASKCYILFPHIADFLAGKVFNFK